MPKSQVRTLRKVEKESEDLRHFAVCEDKKDVPGKGTETGLLDMPYDIRLSCSG